MQRLLRRFWSACIRTTDVQQSAQLPEPSADLNGVVRFVTTEKLNPKSIYDDFVGVPEPGAWMTMLVGFGLLGGALRRHAGMTA